MSTTTKTYQPRLKALYLNDATPKLKEELKLANAHQVPRLHKLVVTVGLGKGKDDKKLFEVATNTLAKITGQQPVQTIARKSIAAFKLREGNPIGLQVTLRGDRMYEFLDRLITVVLPRLRDFHGIPTKSFDQQGNYSLGMTDQSVFPELTFDEITTAHGLEITLVIDAKDPSHSRSLLTALGMPFEKGKKE